MSKHQVFISYSSIDTTIAMDICQHIENNGYTCWVAPRDEQAGTSYGLQITNAIKQSQVVVLIFSVSSNKSEHVLNEVGVAFDNDKKIVPFLLDESEMCADMQYYLIRKHHIKATLDMAGAKNELLNAIRGYIPQDSMPEAAAENDDQYVLATKLTESLISTSTDYSVAVRRFNEIIKDIPNWTHQERILNKAKEIISYSFIGVIGKAINKLMAISKETGPSRALKFCQESKRIVFITLDLSVFALISRLWDNVTQKHVALDDDAKSVIRRCLFSPYKLSLLELLEVLDALIQIYERQFSDLEMPIPELKKVQPLLQNEGTVKEACSKLAALRDTDVTTDHCKIAEDALTVVLQAFNFYMRYNVVSMKWSKYEKTRTDPTKFLHRYVALGLDNKANMDLEKVNFTDVAITTDAVVMFDDNIFGKNSINLYPLVIDLNTLYREHGSKICFFHINPMIDSSLEYVSLDDNSMVSLNTQKIKEKVDDLGDLFSSEEDIAAYNIDNVIESFNHLLQSLLGESFVDFGDL